MGLDLKLLNQLGQHQPGSPEDAQVRRQIDERAIRVSSASQAMTRRFATWWLQRRHTFHYQVDADYMRVWVSDDLNPSEIELDQRSAGMQYFFSFFLVFLVEAEDAHVNSILLLDEPGTSLHGTAQAKIVEFLRKLSENNQVIYTAHSPFMIDADHLETIRPSTRSPAPARPRSATTYGPRTKTPCFPCRPRSAALVPPPRQPQPVRPGESPDFLTAAQLAQRLGVSRETVRRLAIAGALPTPWSAAAPARRPPRAADPPRRRRPARA